MAESSAKRPRDFSINAYAFDLLFAARLNLQACIIVPLHVRVYNECFSLCAAESEEVAYRGIEEALRDFLSDNTTVHSVRSVPKSWRSHLFPLYVLLRRFFPRDIAWLIIEWGHKPWRDKDECAFMLMRACAYIQRFWLRKEGLMSPWGKDLLGTARRRG